MKVLAVHPSALMYTKVFLRLEPLGLELVAGAARDAGHDVRIIDLQVETHKDYWKLVHDFQPDAVCFQAVIWPMYRKLLISAAQRACIIPIFSSSLEGTPSPLSRGMCWRCLKGRSTVS